MSRYVTQFREFSIVNRELAPRNHGGVQSRSHELLQNGDQHHTLENIAAWSTVKGPVVALGRRVCLGAIAFYRARPQNYDLLRFYRSRS